LKPGNIFITAQGTVKVTDFGIAWIASNSPMTQTKGLIGTPFYLSPEQVLGERATAASDIYSLGCVLHQALTGSPPFDGDSSIATALAHTNDPVPSPREHDPLIPIAINDVVERALQKDPAARFASAAEMSVALRSAIASTGAETNTTIVLPEAVGPRTEVMPLPPAPSAPPRVSRRSKRKPLLVVIALLISVAALLWVGDRMQRSAALVKVPAFTGQTFSAASTAAKDHGLKVSRADEVSDKPVDTVIGQQPEPGTLIGKGATISLVVSKGPGNKVPAMIGQTLDEAVKTLVEMGFKPAVPANADGSAIVTGQIPPAGTLAAPGSTVSLTISQSTRHRKGKGKGD
ncbi:MAG: PASTA domain-containing protein, partial [Actinomycetota bacterium]